MTPTYKHLTALKIAIAEKRGFAQFERLGKMVWYDPEGGHLSTDELPNYPGSLDAIHEAEEVIVGDQAVWRDYESAIRDITLHDGRDGGDGGGLYERLIRATAFHRAEAFVEACGLTKRVKEIEATL